jgi:hypothetical protein
MADSSVVVTAWISGTTAVNLTGTEHVYDISGLTAVAAGANGPYATNLIIKDATGDVLLTVPLAIAPSLLNLGPYTGIACNIPSLSNSVAVVNTPFTAQLSNNLTAGQIGVMLGTNKAN